ncbi:MAG TPA: acetamidase/formamidase family protein [Chloroflexota bacterium]|nr:acetamidase/formamidase family protein [Chloroflexota bacterium]
MLRVRRDQFVYSFSPRQAPVGFVEPGERIVFETHDASTSRIRRPEDVHAYLAVRDPMKVNPAAGPVYVHGVRPGDELVVSIQQIDLAPRGYIRAMPGGDVLREGIEGPVAVIVPVENDHLYLPGGLCLPVRPMVGVIGTAPASGEVFTAVPGPQGSNLDVRAVTVGARVHLPVHVDGALLALGDVHASMGDGEVSGTGVEIDAEVTVTVDVLSGEAHARPWIETADLLIATGSAPTPGEAVSHAVEGLTGLLCERLPISRTEAFMLISARGDVNFGQTCGGLDCTVYASFPKVDLSLPQEPA